MTILKLFLLLGFLVSVAQIGAMDTTIVQKPQSDQNLESKTTMAEFYNQQEDEEFNRIFNSWSDEPDEPKPENSQEDQRNGNGWKQTFLKTSLLMKILSIFF